MQDRKWSVIAIGAIVSLLTGALLYVSLKPKQKTKGKTTAAAAVQQVQETTTAEVEVEGEGEQETRDAVQVIDEQELARRVNQALQHVLSNPQAVATDAVQELVDLVKDIDPAAYTPSTRLLTVRV
jgi:outer membrane receptor for Fe3+-dicitrate